MSVAELLADVARLGVTLWLEGSRLRFRGPRGALSEEQRTALGAQRAEVITALRQHAAASVTHAPLSYNQRALWFIALGAPDSTAYNLASASRVTSQLEPAIMRDALQALTDRHAMLRTTYHLGEDGQPTQRTVGWVEVAFEEHYVPGLSEGALRERVLADCRQPISLETGPIFRAALYTRAPGDHVLLTVVHHIAADAWSLGIMADDLRTLHAEALGLEPTVTRRAEREYADFVDWQSRLLAAPEGQRLAAYWQRRLQPAAAELDLPSDRPRPARKSFRGATHAETVSPELLTGIRALARDHSTTLFAVLLAAFDTMLFRLTGNEDLVVGTPTAGRSQEEFARVVGYFVNPVPLRTRVRSGMTFSELLRDVRQTVHEALDAQDYPLPLMVQHSQGARDPSRSPLFEVFFSALSLDQMRAASSTASAGLGLPFAPYPLHQLEGQFDLSLQLAEQEGALDIELRYSTDLFDAATAQRFATHFVGILAGAIKNPAATLDALSPHAQTPDASLQALLAELAARDIRVRLEGEKLRFNAPAGALDDELKTQLARRKAELVSALSAANAHQGLRRVPRTGPLPISFAQRRLWFFDRMQPGTAHYNIPLILRVRGLLNQPALTRALDALIRRHESLRFCLHEEDGNPRAEIRADAGTTVNVLDLSTLDPAAREAEALRLILLRAYEPFDLARGPMARFLLVKLAADEHRLLLCMHHIASDGWSLSVAAREICAVYDAELQGKPSPLQPLEFQYLDFAAWQQDQLSSGLFARQLSYWQRELAGAPAVLELPTDRPRPPVQSYRGKRRSLRMPKQQLEALKAFSRSHGVTLYMTLLAGWQVLLFRYSGQEDIVVASPLANRDRPEWEALIGCFVNNLILRGRLAGNPRLSEFLAQVKATVLRAFDHRELPFDRLVEALRPERSPSHNPIFQVLFTLHSFPQQRMKPAGLEVDIVDLSEMTVSSRFDLTLEMDELEEGELRMAYEYATDLFDAATIERMHAQYLTLLSELVSNAEQTVRDVPLLSEADGRALLGRVNETASEHDRSRCVQDLIHAVALSNPEGIAVEASEERLSYAMLEQRANQLAHLLRARGVGRGSLVGVCLDRSARLPVALLGVLKAGAAYVPVDPAHPAERLSYTLQDAQVAYVVTEAKCRASVEGAQVPLLLLDEDAALLAAQPMGAPAASVTPSDLAYVIYTSGSTGRPKGVEIEHRQFVNFLHAMRAEPGLHRADVLLAVTTPSFDIAGLELFLPLSVGAKTVIASRGDVLDGERLRERIEACGATMMQATPATWRLLLDAGWAGKADLVALCGGEAMPRDLARDLSARVQALWNMYGPTETTVWSTLQRVTDSERDIPIGHAIANTTVYVLDAAGRPAPIGVAGELCIGGEGVARGYRERPELTAEKFVTLSVPGRAAERVYRTGDVVRLRGDLALEFVGRRDHQVKLRGYRIELGEIEAVLAEHPAVRRSTVIVREDSPGDQRLVAYVVPVIPEQLPVEELRSRLRTRLPEYMVPSAIVPLAALPLTPNGKVDRKALPVPQATRAAAALESVVMTDAQRRVAAIWCSVLRLESVGLYENFFDLGGHSLLVIKAHALLRREFEAEVTIVDLFQRTTVAAQAELVSAVGDRTAAGLERAQARAARQVVV
ncbi:MAG: amino acid adenylation domain-containing protein [Pseudomonadota bacterium]